MPLQLSNVTATKALSIESLNFNVAEPCAIEVSRAPHDSYLRTSMNDIDSDTDDEEDMARRGPMPGLISDSDEEVEESLPELNGNNLELDPELELASNLGEIPRDMYAGMNVEPGAFMILDEEDDDHWASNDSETSSSSSYSSSSSSSPGTITQDLAPAPTEAVNLAETHAEGQE